MHSHTYLCKYKKTSLENPPAVIYKRKMSRYKLSLFTVYISVLLEFLIRCRNLSITHNFYFILFYFQVTRVYTFCLYSIIFILKKDKKTYTVHLL